MHRQDPCQASTVHAAQVSHRRVVPLVAARAVTLPWGRPDGDPVTVELLLTTSVKTAVNRKWFAPDVWHPALRKAGIPVLRENGMHALRHFYASSLLHAGESIKALSEYLGHHDPGFTLRTYTHLMPDSEARTRRTMDDILGDDPGAADGLATA